MDMQYVATLLRETKSTRPRLCRKMTIFQEDIPNDKDTIIPRL